MSRSAAWLFTVSTIWFIPLAPPSPSSSSSMARSRDSETEASLRLLGGFRGEATSATSVTFLTSATGAARGEAWAGLASSRPVSLCRFSSSMRPSVCLGERQSVSLEGESMESSSVPVSMVLEMYFP